jgi:hypothetical protein
MWFRLVCGQPDEERMSHQRRWIAVVFMAALGAIVLLAIGTAAASTHSYKSTVTITSGEGTEFTGKVTASNKKCRAGRTLKLYYDPVGGTTSVVGAARTDASGDWDMKGTFTAGDYQAKVTAKTVHSEPIVLHCGGDVTVQARF